ncbi:hypothetical protein RIF29_18046 [Crotalaria pallida]|uniref:Wax synthase domain-containing protein n=1 Tax=Crotalaria pallida TaxID=3830 RepID=A0AAN9FQ70_CROPI
MVTNLLRHTIYIPVKTVSKSMLGPQWASLFGVMASFLISGLMHELLFYYITRVTPTWEVTCFFVIHGLCVVVEYGLMKGLGPMLSLHWAVAGPITTAFLMSTSTWLFFPPLLLNGADERLINEFNNLVDCIVRIL